MPWLVPILTATPDMRTYFRDVVAFHEKFGIPMAEEPTLVDMDLGNFRLRFLTEELDEIVSSHLTKDMAGFFDGLLDLYYVTAGTAAIFGFDYENRFHEVIKNRFSSLDSALQIDLHPAPEYHWAWRLAFHQFTSIPKSPRWPHDLSLGRLIEKLAQHIENIGDSYLEEDIEKMSWLLAELGVDTMLTAAACGLPWEEGWDAVQTANMKKVRAERASDSKRGSTFDVVKPAGWTAPNITLVLRRRGWAE